MSLKLKIMLIIFSVALIPITIMSLTTSYISTDTLVEKEVNTKVNILSDIANKVYLSLSERQLVGINFMLNGNVQELLSRPIDTSTPGSFEKLRFEIEKMLQNYKYLIGTEGLYLYSMDGSVFTNKPFDSFDVALFIVSPWFQQSLLEQKSYFWGEPTIESGKHVVPLVRVVRKILEPDILGYFISTIRESFLHELYATFVEQEVSDFFIINERGTVISQTNKDNVGKHINEAFPNLKFNGSFHGSTFVDQKDGRYLITYHTDSRNGWTYINCVPWQELYKSARNIQILTYVLSVALIIVCFIIALLFSRGIIHPINSLITRMKRAENGDWDIDVRTNTTGEIGQLEHSFGLMLKALKKSMEEKLTIQRQKRKAELKMLEYQINPHFLYNTMSSIIWLSENNENDAVITIASAISELFRISISKGNEVISIADEIQYVKYYLEILNIRYRNAFDVHYDIDDTVLQGYTIKLILQPLVENAIYHGIKPSASTSIKGAIDIEARLDDDSTVLFTIANTGTPLTEERIDALNQFLREQHADENFGIGIRNVYDRIQLAYGKEFGIRFKASDAQTTVVEVRIPFKTKKEDGDE